MWGLGTYLMRLAGMFYGRRTKKTCDICKKKFRNVDEMEVHRRNIHPDAEVTT